MGARLIAAAGLLVLSACGSSVTLHCDDLLPAGEAPYAEVARLVTSLGPRGCARCHNTESPVSGFNFEGPGVSYDALSARMGLIYPQIATGAMPPDGAPWSEADLRLLRTWYCNGALY